MGALEPDEVVQVEDDKEPEQPEETQQPGGQQRSGASDGAARAALADEARARSKRAQLEIELDEIKRRQAKLDADIYVVDARRTALARAGLFMTERDTAWAAETIRVATTTGPSKQQRAPRNRQARGGTPDV